MSELRILIINDYKRILGGAERYIEDLIPSLQSEGLECTSIYIENFLPAQADYRYEISKRYTKFLETRILEQIQFLSPDIIHLHNNKIAARSVFNAIKKSNIPCVQSIHDLRQIQMNDDYAPFIKPFIQIALNLNTKWQRQTVQGFISHSLMIHNLIQDKFTESIVKHIPLYVDTKLFKESDSIDRSKEIILYAGRLEKEKGVLFLIETFINSSLKEKFQLHILGNGSERQHIENLSQEHEKIYFHGSVQLETLISYYNQAFCTVIPSIWQEPFGMIGIEAQACGSPVIASDVGGIYEWCIHNETGLLFESENAKDLERNVLKLSYNNKLKQKLVRNAHQRIKDYFNKGEHVSKLINFYNQVILTNQS